MVLDLDRKALLARDEARAFRHGPALQDPVQLEAEIIVKPAGGMLLDDIGIAGLRFPPPAGGSGVFEKSRFALYASSCWFMALAGAIGARDGRE